VHGLLPNNSFKPTPHRGVNSALCATLRAVATPPRGGLTQALGGKNHSAVALSALQHIGFGQHCSSDGSWPRCLFGQVCCTRSQFACVALAGFGNGDWCGQLFHYRCGRFGDGRLKVRRARSGLPASAFGKSAKASRSPGSFAPNKSFKPTPCRGSGHVLYATLAHVRRPATGRLNSGVRRQKSIRQLRCQRCNMPASVSIALRTAFRRVASSVKSAARAHISHA
jgi:hypothetical protein